MFGYFNCRSFPHRAEQQQPRALMETPQPHPHTTVIRASSHSECDNDDDEYGENEPLPDLEKDDMMARRTGSFQKPIAAKTVQSSNQFLPVPGSVKYSVAPVSAMKPLHNRPKLTEKMAGGRYLLCLNEDASSATNIAQFTGKDEGLIKSTCHMICSSNINNSLWMIYSWSWLTLVPCPHVWVPSAGCLMWFDLCYLYMKELVDFDLFLWLDSWSSGSHMTWQSLCLVWTHIIWPFVVVVEV